MKCIARGIAGSLCLLFIAGCTPSKSPASHSEKPKQIKKKLDLKAELPGAITGTGWHIPWRMPDPKHPGGPTIPVLIADAERGAMADEQNNPTIRLSQVHAEIYHEGRHSANIRAAEITANQRDRTVHGTGGVTVTSLTNPPDTVLTADTIRWDTRTSVIVAVGHAHVVSRPPNGTPVEQSGGKITFDTALKQFKIE